MLAVCAVEQEEKSITAGLPEQLPRLALEFSIKEHRCLHCVPVVNVMGRDLVIPNEFSSVWIERNDAASVEIVSGARFARQNGIGISNSPVKKIQRRIISARHPRHAAAEENCIAILRPSFRARF